ncbi:bifunctional purine biosynthesis protein purH-like [Hibiscus syriacus]|uniref:Bifunctional purine biosynthesis protein purH-like n=1 Tax=Hibiscus syriacus TaxID=106335 RepID=A0A6A2WGF8_HIBSY|nr:bifunctional purine biosynthesis protein purH-like [Hibiscus syriacus]
MSDSTNSRRMASQESRDKSGSESYEENSEHPIPSESGIREMGVTVEVGSENTTAVAAGFALFFVIATSSIVLQVGKNSPPVKTVEYIGPTFSYYINKFKPTNIIHAAAPSVTKTTSSELPPEVSEIKVQSELQPEPSSLTGTS